MPKQKRRISEPEKKIVAARQQWCCSQCHTMLDATYQVDHTVALADGGDDHTANMTAMCVTCHARKTQHENATRARAARAAHTEPQPPREGRHPNTEDIVLSCGSRYMCSNCKQTRPIDIDWMYHTCPKPHAKPSTLMRFAHTHTCPARHHPHRHNHTPPWAVCL